MLCNILGELCFDTFTGYNWEMELYEFIRWWYSCQLVSVFDVICIIKNDYSDLCCDSLRLDFQAVEHLIRVNKQFQIIPWYQKHMVWHQNEVSRYFTLRDLSFLINAQIVMVAIYDSIKNTPGWQFHTHMDIFMRLSNMNIQNIKTASNKPMSTPTCW